MSKNFRNKESDKRSSSKKGKLHNSSAEIERIAVDKASETHRTAVAIARQFIKNGEEGNQYQLNSKRRKVASKFFNLEAAVDDNEDVSGDEDEEDEDAIGDEDPKVFSFKHPLNSTNNDSNLPDKVISFEGVYTAETAQALLFLNYPKCKNHIILNLKLMFSI